MKKIFFLLLAFIFISHFSQAQDSLQQYTGKYVFPDGSAVTEVTVELKEGKLQANSVMGNSGLVAKGDDHFYISEFDGDALFKRDSAGKVNGVEISVHDVFLAGKKVSPSPMPVAIMEAAKDPERIKEQGRLALYAKLP